MYIIPPTLKEVKKQIRRLKDDKSSGSDNIPAELIKQGGQAVLRAIHKIIRRVHGWKKEKPKRMGGKHHLFHLQKERQVLVQQLSKNIPTERNI